MVLYPKGGIPEEKSPGKAIHKANINTYLNCCPKGRCWFPQGSGGLDMFELSLTLKLI